MVTKTLEITSSEGLRAKTAALFVHTASKYDSQILIEKNNKKINAKSIIGVLSLGVKQNETINVIIMGSDEVTAGEALAQLVETDFNRA